MIMAICILALLQLQLHRYIEAVVWVQIVISDTACVAKLAKVSKGHLQLHGLMTDFLPLVVFINGSESVPEDPSQYSHFKVSNHILVYIWLLHYICIFGGSCPPDWISPRAKFTYRPSLAFSCTESVTARHSSSGSAKLCGVVQGTELQNFRRGRYLYSAGRPSHWASAHILVWCKTNFKLPARRTLS